LYTGLRISELLALTWADIDLDAGVIHVRTQLSRAHRGVPAQRVAPKTKAAIRDIPLVPQLGGLLRERTCSTTRATPPRSARAWPPARSLGCSNPTAPTQTTSSRSPADRPVNARRGRAAEQSRT
jgi:integrase